jgi:hypothetical protein
MPKKTKTLNIPHGGDLKLNKNQERLLIKVNETCQWCYSDPKKVFSSLLAPGQYGPGEYGPYDAVNDGDVTYGDPIDPPCKPVLKIETAHTITVSG